MVDILKHYRKLVKAHRKAVSLSTNLDPETAATTDVTDRDLLKDTPTQSPSAPKTNLPVATKAD
jgi:hypothetical protein